MQVKTVVAALIVHNQKILIARRAPSQSHAGLWEFPGGKIEANETPQQSLAREIHEELGLSISVGDFCSENTFEYKDFTIHLKAYWAKQVCNATPTLCVHDLVRFVLPTELPSYQLTAADIPIMRVAIKTLCRQNES